MDRRERLSSSSSTGRPYPEATAKPRKNARGRAPTHIVPLVEKKTAKKKRHGSNPDDHGCGRSWKQTAPGGFRDKTHPPFGLSTVWHGGWQNITPRGVLGGHSFVTTDDDTRGWSF